MSKLSRQDFIKSSVIIAGGMMFSPIPYFKQKRNVGLELSDRTSYWYQKPVRAQETVLRDIDAIDYDTDIVVDYLKKTGSNILVINAGGIIDFFQNPLPAANINPYMKGRDILKEITTACQKEGIKVIGRVDFRGVKENIYKQHPDWFSYEANGEPKQFDYTQPKLYASCYTGHYRNEHAEEFIRYIFENYALDGIWHNAFAVHGICYCDSCQKSYKSETGKSLPVPESASKSELDRYMEWKRKTANKYMAYMKEIVKSYGEDKAYTAEIWGPFSVTNRINSGVDLYDARDHFDIMVCVAFLEEENPPTPYKDLNYAYTTVKFLKSIAPEKEPAILFGGNGTHHRMVKEPSVDTQLWLWEMLAAGGRFWNCYFTDVPTVTYDQRNAFVESEAYNLVKEHANLYKQQVSVAKIGVYYSRPTRLSYREETEAGDSFGASIEGIEHVLMENHIQYDYIPNEPQINQESLQKYKLVILSNIRCMSNKEVQVLKKYVRDGGNVIATYCTSLYDIDGNEKQNYGLADVFGVDYTGQKVNTRVDNYQFILNKHHPIVKDDSSQTELLFTAGYTLLSKPRQTAEVICTHVPTIPNQPPDLSSVKRFSTEFPTIVENEYGRGSTIYFANQPDVIAREIGNPDVRNLLLRSIRLLAGKEMFVESNAPESVHIGLTKSRLKAGEYILSLVNTTSGPKRPIDSLLPVESINVKLRLEGGSLSNHKVLRSQGECQITSNGQVINLNISKLEDFCSIYFQMET